jgi:hypothetical protein
LDEKAISFRILEKLGKTRGYKMKKIFSSKTKKDVAVSAQENIVPSHSSCTCHTGMCGCERKNSKSTRNIANSHSHDEAAKV